VAQQEARARLGVWRHVERLRRAHARDRAGRDVAHHVAARLARGDAGRRQPAHHGRRVLDVHEVQLEILAGRHVSDTVGVLLRHVRQRLQLLSVQPAEDIPRAEYEDKIARPIAAFLRMHKLQEQILYIVTTSGVPLRIAGSGGRLAEAASVDSELTLLYSDMRGPPHGVPAGIHNPFFGKVSAAFRHPDFPIYLVTRLTGYDFADVKGLIDRALLARNRGNFVIDLKKFDNGPGNGWLRDAARALPKDRVILDDTGKVLYNQRDVIAYASWGSNDPDRKQRHVDFQWLPGAIMTEYVSTNGRTFARRLSQAAGAPSLPFSFPRPGSGTRTPTEPLEPQ